MGNKAGENLARQSVAALLNICSGDVGYSSEFSTIQALKNYVNAAFTSKDVNTAGSHLDFLNNAGCPLSGTKATTASTCPAPAPASNPVISPWIVVQKQNNSVRIRYHSKKH